MPVMAWLRSEMMPSSLAMATAVSMWSPVIMTTFMPAPWASSMAAFTSGRTGSIMPERPTNVRSCSSVSGSKAAGGSLPHSRRAEAMTRSAWSAMLLFCSLIRARTSSVMGLTPSSERYDVHRASTTSGPPFVCCT